MPTLSNLVDDTNLLTAFHNKFVKTKRTVPTSAAFSIRKWLTYLCTREFFVVECKPTLSLVRWGTLTCWIWVQRDMDRVKASQRYLILSQDLLSVSLLSNPRVHCFYSPPTLSPSLLSFPTRIVEEDSLESQLLSPVKLLRCVYSFSMQKISWLYKKALKSVMKEEKNGTCVWIS